MKHEKSRYVAGLRVIDDPDYRGVRVVKNAGLLVSIFIASLLLGVLVTTNLIGLDQYVLANLSSRIDCGRPLENCIELTVDAKSMHSVKPGNPIIFRSLAEKGHAENIKGHVISVNKIPVDRNGAAVGAVIDASKGLDLSGNHKIKIIYGQKLVKDIIKDYLSSMFLESK